MKSINNKLLEVSPKDHLAYYGEFKSGYRVEKKMETVLNKEYFLKW